MPSSKTERSSRRAPTHALGDQATPPPPTAHNRRRALVTAALTLALAGGFVLANQRLRLDVRDGGGFERTVPLATLWGAFFERLPSAAPGILRQGPLVAGLVVATLALAYVFVATLRLRE